nr:MAG TPA: hypothetical protein [Caudoviricetes sp.]
MHKRIITIYCYTKIQYYIVLYFMQHIQINNNNY